MADQTAERIAYLSATNAAADTVSLSRKVKQLKVENYHATQLLYGKIFTSRLSEADAIAKANAAEATGAADEHFFVAPGKTVVVLKTTRPIFAAVSLIASAAGTTCVVSGQTYHD